MRAVAAELVLLSGKNHICEHTLHAKQLCNILLQNPPSINQVPSNTFESKIKLTTQTIFFLKALTGQEELILKHYVTATAVRDHRPGCIPIDTQISKA